MKLNKIPPGEDVVSEPEGEVAQAEAGRQVRPSAERRQDPGNPLHFRVGQSQQGVERRRKRRGVRRQVPQHSGKQNGPIGELRQGRAERLPGRREGGRTRKRGVPVRGLFPAAVPLPRRRRQLRQQRGWGLPRIGILLPAAADVLHAARRPAAGLPATRVVQ